MNFDPKLGSPFPLGMLPGPLLWPPPAAALLPPSLLASIKPPSPVSLSPASAAAGPAGPSTAFKRPWETESGRGGGSATPSAACIPSAHPLLLQQGEFLDQLIYCLQQDLKLIKDLGHSVKCLHTLGPQQYS